MGLLDLVENLFCSKGYWRPTWMFAIFGQMRHRPTLVKMPSGKTHSQITEQQVHGT